MSINLEIFFKLKLFLLSNQTLKNGENIFQKIFSIRIAMGQDGAKGWGLHPCPYKTLLHVNLSHPAQRLYNFFFFYKTCFVNINILEISIKFIILIKLFFSKNWITLKWLTRQYHNTIKSLNIHAFIYFVWIEEREGV